MWNKEIFEKLEAKRSASRVGGGAERINKQHSQGKLTAGERLSRLFDDGSYTEIQGLLEGRLNDFGADKKRVPGDGVVAAYGYIHGRKCFVAAEDFTVHGGTMGESHLKKICRIMDMAYDIRAPFIGLFDSGGARIEEGVVSLAEMGGLFLRNTKLSGVVPQIAAIMGPCAGGACYSPALCDFVFMVRNTGYMFLTGPEVVKSVTGQTVSAIELGGADVHAAKSGVAHFIHEDDEACLAGIRKLLAYLPQNNSEHPPTQIGETMNLCKGLQEVVLEDRRKCYDMHAVIGAMVDKHSFCEIQQQFAQNAIIGLGRMEGEVVGFVASQPNYMGGALDCNAADKVSRFIRFCDCFSIPLVTLVDVPAFLPGKDQECSGIIRHGAKMLYAYSEATVPKITLILRKAYGGAYIAMNSKEMGADLVYAWPIAELAVMGAEGAVSILFKRPIQQSADPVQERQQLMRKYEDAFMSPYVAAARGYVDEVIRPEETRDKLLSALHLLQGKRKTADCKKHGNMPV